MTIPPYARGYEDFAGTIGRTTAESERAWPPEHRAAPGAPNVIVMLLDDMGYSDIGPFGSEIATPTLDGLAARGVALTNYHTTPVCSPARAALLTGLNPHRAGYASVANADPGFPGMRLELDDDVVTVAEALRANGYATWAIGKWHLTRDALMNEGASKGTWPCQRGFDHYYGVLEGVNSFFHPNQLVCDNTVIEPDLSREDYYLTDDYTDQAITRIKALRADDSRKPFFLYFAHTAMHGPLGAKPADLAKYRGRYAMGWDALREQRHARQLELGIIPDGTPLPPRNHEPGLSVEAWDSLDAAERDRLARYMEVYAAMVDNVDQNLARILATVDAYGELDNTIVLFTSDNGGTAEGGPSGTRSYFSQFIHDPGLPDDWEADVDRDPELIGGPRTMVHYPRGWGMASNTPFRLYKGQTFAGGIRVPLVLSWPAGLPRAAEDSGVRSQYQYVTDVFPTLLDLLGLDHPGARHNRPAKSMDGASFAPVLRDADAASTHREQYSEFGGQRGFYRDGWKIVTLHRPGADYDDGEWELYNLEEDPTELRNRAADEPEKLAELAQAWEHAAWANTVFPLPAGQAFDPRPRRPAEDELASPVTLLPGTPRLERYRSSRLTNRRQFTITIDVRVAPGDEGVLVAHGDQGGGYVIYVEDGRLHAAYNEYGKLRELPAGPLDPGEHIIRVTSMPRRGFRADFRLEVDGEPRAALDEVWLLTGMAPFSGIDVGINRGGPVHWDLYERHGSFPFTGGDLRSVRYEPGPVYDEDPAAVARLEAHAARTLD